MGVKGNLLAEERDMKKGWQDTGTKSSRSSLREWVCVHTSCSGMCAATPAAQVCVQLHQLLRCVCSYISCSGVCAATSAAQVCVQLHQLLRCVCAATPAAQVCVQLHQLLRYVCSYRPSETTPDCFIVKSCLI